ncbi:hypothetical protein N7534_008512, partial [Penicillium rubens]
SIPIPLALVERKYITRVYREVLLRFKPISSLYTSSSLNNTLLETLLDYNITDRVFGLIIDNISNNKTLATSL